MTMVYATLATLEFGADNEGERHPPIEQRLPAVVSKVHQYRNVFIVDLPFTNQTADPQYVPGFGDYGSISTALRRSIFGYPTPAGDLTLPLDNGLRDPGPVVHGRRRRSIRPRNWRDPEYRPVHAGQAGAQRPGTDPRAVPASSTFATASQGPGRAGSPRGNDALTSVPYATLFDPTGKIHQPFSTPERPGSPRPAQSVGGPPEKPHHGIPGPAPGPGGPSASTPCRWRHVLLP